MSKRKEITAALKTKALELGFAACGVARTRRLTHKEGFLREWLEDGYQGKMAYMANHFDKRLNPVLLVPGSVSVLSLALNYFPAENQPSATRCRISRYAYGKDYHFVIKQKLQLLADFLESLTGHHQYRIFTDSAPVLERTWAQEAGLGGTGKNTCLIIPRKGSYFFLGEIITNAALEPDPPFEKDLCGKCTRCIEACPTGAIIDAGKLDASKCISYLTIELKDNIPEPWREKCRGWIFGCDICQEVCPHNRHATPHQHPELQALKPVTTWSDNDWQGMTREAYIQEIKKTASALARVKYEKLMDNIRNATCDAGCR